MGSPSNVVIVGGGLAAARCATTLRDEGFQGGVTVIGSEDLLPYERPPLSKGYLAGGTSREELLVHGQSWYANHDVEVRTSQTVTSIDRLGAKVMLASGEEMTYDHLILATGSVPRRLPVAGAELALTLRNLQDSDRLKSTFGRASSLAIIGAGWIGLEVAATARQAGLEVTVIDHASLPLEGVLGHDIASYFASLHRDHGVDLRMTATVQEVLTDGQQAVGVRFDDTMVHADAVLMAVGAEPAVGLARAADLMIGDGIIADENFRTSDPSIQAIGDVARVRNVLLGTSVRVEHWDNAIRQGAAAATALLGRRTPYDWHPYFFTDQYDLGMEYVGHGAPGDGIVIRGSLESGAFIAFWIRDEIVTAAMNVNIWDVNATLRAIVGQRVSSQRLSDEEVSLDSLAGRRE